MKNDFPNWIFRTKENIMVAFKDVRCVEGFDVAVRVGVDGVLIFGKNGHKPNLFHMNAADYASLNDFKGKQGDGIRPFEVGCIRLDGSLWLSDCFYEPGLIEKDYEDIKSLLYLFFNQQKTKVPTEKQLNRIHRLIDCKGKEFVKSYFYSKFPTGNFEQINREQAQKVITGLQIYEKRAQLQMYIQIRNGLWRDNNGTTKFFRGYSLSTEMPKGI